MRLRLESISEEGVFKEYNGRSSQKLLKIAAVFMEKGIDRFVSFLDKKECLVMTRVPNGYMIIDGNDGNVINIDKLDDALKKAIFMVGNDE